MLARHALRRPRAWALARPVAPLGGRHITFRRLAFLALALATLLAARTARGQSCTAPSSASPGPPLNLGGGENPRAIVVADVNNDSKLDFVTANFATNSITVRLGNGDGTFGAPVPGQASAGQAPWALAAADFNQDGNLDLAVSDLNVPFNSVSILLGDGTGRFNAAVPARVTIDNGSQSVAVADFNRDGKPDFVAANTGADTVSIRLGNGDGSFFSPAVASITVGSNPYEIVAGDFNRDGKPDFAALVDTAGSGYVDVRYGNGDGTFAGPSNINLPGALVSLDSLVSADFNRDGRLDLAVAHNDSLGGAYSVYVILGNGSGSFDPPSGPFPVTVYVRFLALGDFNGDGSVDLAVPQGSGSLTVTVLLGTGTGGFGSPWPFSTDAGPEAAAAGDFNGDGRADLATANSDADNVSILLNDFSAPCANSSFGPAGRVFSVNGAGPITLARGQFDGNSAPDLVVGNFGSANLNLFKGTGSGSFQSPTVFGGPGEVPRHVVAGFFNNDGNMDVAVADSGGGQVMIHFGDGNGNFPSGNGFSVGSNPVFVDVVDLTADGKPDLAVANNGSGNVSILRGDGVGGFTLLANVPVGAGSAPSAVADGDFNGDGRLDLAVTDAALNVCHILLGTGGGGLGPFTDFGLGAGAIDPESLVVADFNQDGVPDLATANFGSNTVSVLLGNGDGTFALAGYSPLAVGNGPQSITAADFNGDGKADLATADKLGDRVSVLLGNAGGFSLANPFVAAGGPVAVVAGDFDGDGLLDLATANNSGQNVLLLRGDGLGGFAPAPRYSAGTSPRLVSTGDFNGDGILDLVAPNSTNSVSLLLGDTMGGFAAPTSYAAGNNPQQAAVGDFNRDGILDLAVPNGGAASTSFSILLGNPTPPGGLGAPSSVSVSGTNPRFIAAGDFDQDGRLDLAVAYDPTIVTAFRGDGAGGFTSFWNLGLSGTPAFIAVGDFNGNGDPDLAVAHGNNVSIFSGRPTDAGFSAGTTLAAGTKPVSIAVADFDRDGDLDLAVASEISENIFLFRGNGAGNFTPFPSSPMAAGKVPKSIVAGDFNGDGKTDLAVASFTSRSLSVHPGRGDGTFDSFLVRAYGVGGEPVSLATGDFDRNGKTDLVASHILGDGVSVLLNTNCKARRLSFFADVSSCDTPGSLFLSQPILQVLDDGANPIQCDTGNNVSVGLLGGPGSLTGTTTKPTSAGMAVFDDLRVTAAGRGYRLRFNYPGVAKAESRSFSQGLTVDIAGPAQMCASGPATLFTALPGYDKYDWALDGAPVSVTPRVLLSGLSPAPHLLRLDVLQDTCFASDVHALTVDDDLSSLTISPPGPFTVCQATGCFGPMFSESHTGGGPLAFQWGFRTASGATEPVTNIPGQTGNTYVVSGPDFPGPGTYYLVLTATPSCGAPLVSNEVTITVDNSQAQDTVRFFTVTSTANTNTLEWMYPPGYGWVAIRYNSGPTTCSFPLTVLSGTPLPDQTGPLGGRGSFPHTGLTNDDHYCYTVFVDKGGAGTGPYSAGRSNQGRPFDTGACPTKWAFSVGSTTLTSPGVGVDRIHVAANDNSLHSVLKGGSGGVWPGAPWQPVPMNGPSQGRPSTVPITLGAASRVVFLGSQDKHVYAIDADTGALVSPWSPAPDLGAMVQAGPSGIFTAFGGAYDYILVGTRDSANPNKFFVLNVSNGSTAYAVTGAPFGSIGIISSQAVVDYVTRRVYFTSYAYGLFPDDNTVWCVNLVDGSVVWAKPYGNIAAGPTLSRDKTRLYVGTNTGDVKALNTSDGLQAWSYSTVDGPVKGFVTIDRLSPTNDLYFATTNKVWSIADSGGTPPTFRWSRPLNNPSTPVYLTGSLHVYVGTGDGTLSRLNSVDGSDAPGIPVAFPLVLGDGSAAVGSPTIDPRDGFVYVGTDAGVVYATQIP